MANEMENVPSTHQNDVSDGQDNPDVSVLADEQTASSGLVDSPTSTQRERAPGTFGPPSPSRGPADTGKPSKLRSLFGKKGGPAPDGNAYQAPTTKEKRPGGVRTGRRVSTAETIEQAWSGIGGLAIRGGNHVPLGRCMQWQSPVVGEMLDEAVKDSIIDKVVLQKIVKARSRFDLLGAVFGMPAVVIALETHPELAPTLIPMLESSIRSALPLMVPAIKRVKEREKRALDAAKELFADDPDFDPTVDPVQQIISMMFQGWQPASPSPEPSDMPEEAPVS